MKRNAKKNGMAERENFDFLALYCLLEYVYQLFPRENEPKHKRGKYMGYFLRNGSLPNRFYNKKSHPIW